MVLVNNYAIQFLVACALCAYSVSVSSYKLSKQDSVLPEKQNSTEECDCGIRGTCSFENGEKKCDCDKWFTVKDGICTKCYCGHNDNCSFENGKKICLCREGYFDFHGLCEVCNCGPRGNCSVVNGQKLCACEEGSIDYFGECTGTCVNDSECLNHGTCSDFGEDNICRCQTGYRGERCEICPHYLQFDNKLNKCRACDCGPSGHKRCTIEDGKNICECLDDYADKDGVCTECICGEKETCIFENGKKKCICREGFAVKHGACTKTCVNDFSCYDESTCEKNGEHKFCTCKPGIIGDRCEIVIDCTINGKYENCSNSGGDCYYALHGAICHCPDYLKFDDNLNICRKCDCGSRGTCSFENEGTRCDCDEWYAVKDGICTECYCGPESNCSFENGEKMCSCKDSSADKDGRCRETCVEDFDCKHGGECEESGGSKFCSCKSGFEGDLCEMVSDCYSETKYMYCEDSGGTCYYNGTTVVCDCPDLYAFDDSMCRECDCGPNGNCSFEESKKQCDCDKDIDECLNRDICPNTTTCYNLPGNYTCLCKDGYRLEEGKSLKIDGCRGLCDPDPCKNGICTMTKDYVRYCRCEESFSGPFCEGRIAIETKSSPLLIGIIAFSIILIIVLSGSLVYVCLKKKRM